MTEKVDSHRSGTLSALDLEVVHAVPPGGNWRDLPDDFPSQRVKQIRHGSKNGGGSRSTYYGRLRWDRPAYTVNTFITRPGNGCFIHPSADRLITAREAARLQSFPDSTTFVGPLRARAMQIGNAVPPLLAYQLGRTIPPGPFVDLFCGAGGMSIGFELAGHRLVAAADSDRNAVKAAQVNSPDGELVEQMDLSDLPSLTRLARSAMKRAPDGLAALVGGPPCQGFSTAGPCRVGDDRNRLVQTFLSAVKLMKPAVVVMENVPALLWRGKAFLDELLGELDKLGYNAEYALLHTEAYGVPQLRRRLIVQATRTGTPVWPAPTHERLEPSFPRFQPTAAGPAKPAITVADAIRDLPIREGVDLDAQVSLTTDTSDYQRWCRGLIEVDALMPSELLPSTYAFTPHGRR